MGYSSPFAVHFTLIDILYLVSLKSQQISSGYACILLHGFTQSLIAIILCDICNISARFTRQGLFFLPLQERSQRLQSLFGRLQVSLCKSQVYLACLFFFPPKPRAAQTHRLCLVGCPVLLMLEE